MDMLKKLLNLLLAAVGFIFALDRLGAAIAAF